MNINVNSCKKNLEWYKKPTDTRVVLNFHSCAPIQHKKNIVERTVHRVFKSTSTWQNFDKALKETEINWLKSQYPESWIFKIITDALQKITRKRRLKNESEKVQLTGQKLSPKDVKPLFFLQYRDNIRLQLKRKLEKNVQLTTIFTTRKLCTFLPSLKSSFDRNPKSHVYKICCCGCSSTYIGRTCRHLDTRISEHQKTSSPVAKHAVECCGAPTAFNYKIIYQCQDSEKFTIIEVLHISRCKSQLNTQDK